MINWYKKFYELFMILALIISFLVKNWFFVGLVALCLFIIWFVEIIEDKRYQK